MRMFRDITNASAKINTTTIKDGGGGSFKKIVVGIVAAILVISLYFEYVRRSQIGSLLVWNFTGEVIKLNNKPLQPSPLSIASNNSRELFKRRRDVNYYTTLSPSSKEYHYLYFDIHQLKRREETHPGFRIKFQVGIRTVALGCPSLLHDAPYSLMTISYDKQRQRYYSICSHFDIKPFLARFPIGSFHSPRHVVTARRYFEKPNKRIRVYRVTPAHAKLNTLRF